jgi:NADH-ubiquinone oxidoreductase chain 1
MSVCWTVLLPVIIAYVVLIPCFVYSINILPVNITLI